jgi:hemerythrin
MTLPIIRKKNILWKIEYNIHVEHIDIEHKQLFDMAQKALEVNSLLDQEKRNEELKNIISKLLMYTKIHFAHEQRYMKEIGYPELDYHIILHKNMVESLTLLIKDLNKLNLDEIEDKLYIFIEEYFLHHIITEDKKIHIWNTPLEELKKDFGWRDFYSVSNQYIDSDHKILFDIAHEAFKTVDSPDRVNKIRTIIKKLYDYMKKHFENEEKYMAEIGYPSLKTHKELHENIILQLNNFIKQLAQIKLTLFEKELARIIDISLLQHIIQEDRKIIAWLKSNPITK